MVQRSLFDDLQLQHDLFKFDVNVPLEEEEKEQCSFAKEYEAYLERVCEDVFKNPTHIAINEADLDCYLKYMELRKLVPKNHRNCIGDRVSHHCLFHVLENYYDELRFLEASLPRQRLYLPPAVLPPELPPVQPPPLFGDVFVDEPK